MENDRLAQKALYDKYKRAMYTLAYRIMGNFEDANDVLQEAFVKIFRGLPGFRGESTLGAWIKTIVVRTAYSKLRKEKRFFEPVDNIASSMTIDWGHRLDADYLEQAIMALPEGYRSVFILIEVEGYSHKEIADLLDITESTSRSNLVKARVKLQEALIARNKIYESE